MGTSSVKVWIGIALAALGFTAIAAASSSKPTPAPAPTGPAPWTIKQGERYRVTLAAPVGGGGFNPAFDWTLVMQAALTANAPGEYKVVSTTVVPASNNLIVVVDALGPTHVEQNATFTTFTSFPLPTPFTVVSVEDLGPTPGAAASLPSPTAAPPTAAPSPGNAPAGAPSPTATPPAAAPTPTASGTSSVSWTMTQGERYQVTLTAPAFGGFNAQNNWTPVVQAGLDSVAPGQYSVASSTVDASQNLVFSVDVLGPTRVEPGSTFTSFQFPTPVSVVSVEDLGPTPAAAPAAPSAGGPTAAQLIAASNFSFLTGGSAQWVQGPSVSAGGRGRVTIPASSAPATRDHFIQWVQTSTLPNLFGNALFVWAPGDALPPDWPTDDPNAATGWHFEFVSQNASQSIAAADIATAMNAGPSYVALWSAQGTGPAQITRPIVLNWDPVTELVPSAHVRMTVAQSDLATIAQAVGMTGVISTGPSACAGFLNLVQFAAFDQTVTNGSPLVLTWCGVDFLPPDWPPDDQLGEYHLEFRVLPSSGTPAPISNLPFPILGAWQAQGPGA